MKARGFLVYIGFESCLEAKENFPVVQILDWPLEILVLLHTSLDDEFESTVQKLLQIESNNLHFKLLYRTNNKI